MRKILINLLVLTLLCGSSVMAQFNGSGTQSDPYLISTQQDLKNLVMAVNNSRNDFSGKFFKQTADLDFVDSQVFPDGFIPIGDKGRNRPFSGTYDGDGHSISKLYVSGYDDAGMFGYINNASIKNLNFENANIVVDRVSNVAVAVANAENSTILNITASGQIKAVGNFDGATLSGIVGVSVRSTISGCVSILSFDVEEANANLIQVAGIARVEATISNCLVSTFIKGTPQRYFPIGDEATISKCIVVESNGIPSEIQPTYSSCYFDFQNTRIAEFPVQQTFINGFYARQTSELTTGSFFNDANWTEITGLYPRPASVANTNVAMLAASPMTLSPADCITSVVSNFTVSTANNVVWATESNNLQISGSNVSIVNAIDSTVEIYAFRNGNVKNIQLLLVGNELGSKGNPYRISSEADFIGLASFLSSDTTGQIGPYLPIGNKNFDPEYDRELYFLVDSDFTITNLIPIGLDSPFRWHFDGGNHTITVEQQSEYYGMAGLFASIEGATISNITVSYNNVSTEDDFYWGGIAGYAENSIISNCKVMGSIENHFDPESDGFFGGIVANASETMLYNCVNMAELYLYSGQVGITTGGIVGYGDSITMRSCVNFGYIHGYPDQGEVGGLIGSASSSTFIGCANYGDLEAIDYEPGAFAGVAFNSTFTDCANYSNRFLAFAQGSEGSTYTNNINVPIGASTTLSYDNSIDGLITLGDLTVGGNGNKTYNTCSNNYTDKQIVPFTGTSNAVIGVLTSELTSGNVDLSPEMWIFVNGRYPMPRGTDIDNDIVKLATTPIFFYANSDDDFHTISSVRSNFELPSSNGISWMLDSVTLTSSTFDVESRRQDSIAVSLTLRSYIDENYREYGIVIPARVGSPENPLLIESLSDFSEFAQAVSASTNTSSTYKGMAITNGGHGLTFKLMTDISSTNRINRPSSFSGNFNGGGHTITVKQSDIVSNSTCGLFPSISFATIDSLNIVTNGSISANVPNYAAILCTEATNSTISNCMVTISSNFSGPNGAVVCAVPENSSIINCSTNGSGIVTLGSEYSGGIVCYSKNSKISNCTNNVKVQPNRCLTAAGGIVASGYSLILENCVNNGDIILTDQSYAAGIVGTLEDEGSNSQNVIRTSINNGYIYANNATGGRACGIYGGNGQVKANIEKCVNSGSISGLDCASGIAGSVNGSVSNCANYGSVECPQNITGIAMECSSMTGNVVACRASYGNNYSNYTQDVISPDADEDDFFDEQITEIKVDSLRLGFYDNGTPRTTQMMVGSALANDLPGDWDFTDGLYPLPAGLDTNDPRNKLARLPIILSSDGIGRSERITAVISDITLPQVEGVTWETSNPDVISVPSGGGVAIVTNQAQEEQVTITATCEGVSRSFTFTVHSANGVSADNPIVITSCHDIMYNMCNNESYPSGGYGFYFKLGNNIEINRYDINSEVDENFYVNQENLNVLYPSTYPFRGHFDGDGHSIIWQNSEYEGDYYGLFKYTDGAEISNLTMYYSENGNYNYSGTLVGNAKATTIRNCAVYSNLSASDRVGGIVDVASDGTVISNCMFVGELSSKNIGGIVADATDTRIDNSISMLRKSAEGETLETGGAIVLSAKNVTVDSCLVVGDNYYGRINVVSASNELVSASNCYYDKQMWIPADGDTINNIGVTTRELTANGLFNWSHNEGKYPVPAGTENLAPATLVATPMLIGETDEDVMHITELGISNDDDVQWAVNNTTAIVGYSVSCVEEPQSAEIVATYSDGTLSDQALYYNFTREITVTKGVVEFDAPENLGLICEGSEFTLSVNNGSALAYSWNLPEGLTADSYDTQSVTVRVDDNYLRDNSPANISVEVSFDGCVVPKEIGFTTIPSPSHFRVNDTAVCTGSDIIVNCVLDEGYEEYVNNFFLSWYDASDMNTSLLGDSVSATGYYIPILTEDRALRIIARNLEGNCIDTLNVTVSVNPITPITVVGGEPNQQICEGELMEPVVFSVANPTYSLPDRIYAEYDTANNLLTLSGRPYKTNGEPLTYNIFACGNNFSGTIDVSQPIMISTDESFSKVINLGENINIRLEGYVGVENILTWESLDGTETFTADELGLHVWNIDRIDFLQGIPEIPGEYIYHINIPANGACPAVTYDNFLGVYDTEELVATALDATLCEGETATLATVERPGAYGGDYVWTMEGDTVGSGSRINVIPPVGTSTYEVACGGKRMYGEFEVGDYLYPDEAFGETGYSMLKNFEFLIYYIGNGYLIANVEEDSLLLMSLSMVEEVEWSQAPEMLAATDEDLYLPSAGELGYVLDNYSKFYLALREVSPAILTSTEKDANTVYALNIEYGLMLEYLKTEPAVAMGFKKIAKSEVINMVGRTSNISRTGSVDIIVSDRHEMSVSTDDVLCNTDTAHVAIETEYPIVNWYNAISSDEQVVVENGTAVLPEGSYIAIGTDEYGSCHDTLEVKVKDLAFYMPQDTTVCDSAVLTIAKEDVTVMLGDEVIDGQTITITESGTYDITLIGIGDTCREEKTINVTVNQSYRISFDTIVLDSEFVWNGETYSATGDYEQRFTSVGGCDSVVTVHLTIVNTETEFAVYGNVTEGDGVSQLSGVNVVSGGASTVTDEAGYYVIMVSRANPILQFAKAGYNFVCDTIAESGQHNVVMLKPEMSVSLSDDSYETNPYVMRQFTVQLSNTGDGPMAWSSLVETAQTRNVPHRRNSTTMWEYADTVIRTNNNAEQAIATDGYYIYTASWQRAGEFSRYSIDNGYLETFIIEGVGGIRNMTYGGNGFFFATDNTNKIYKINMDSQSLEDVITLNDPDLQIRYCAYSTAEDLLYIGNWTNLYKLVAYNTAYPTLIPLSYTMDNVYSVAYDEFSGATPCLWAFSQVSENNGPFAKIYKLNTNGVQVEGMVHYINDASLASPSSLAGGICVSQYLYDDRYVLLANVQNTNATNNIAVYELGRKNSWVSTDVKGGVIPVGGSIDVTVTEYAVENGSYTANLKFKPVVCMPEVMEVGLSMAVSTPQCAPVANLVAETDTFHTINLSWEAAERGDYESVSYLLYEEGTTMPIDTVEATSYIVSNPEVGNHCYYVRTLMHGDADCVSNPSNTACAEIEEFPCNVQLSLTARAYGDRIRLEWNDLYGVVSYGVFEDVEGGEGLYIGTEPFFEDTLALPETDYCYRVVAYFRNDECGPKTSNSACARISAGGCSEVPVVTATAIGNSVALSWGKIQGVHSYSLYKDGKYLTSTSDTAYYDMMLDYETEYCYVVEINCGYGMFGLSDEVCVTTEKEYEEQNAIELITDESIDLYPNPAADMFFVEGRQMQGLQIVNFAGQVVYELDNISDDRLPIDASGYAPGVYAVRIILSDSRSVVKRIVIGR